MKLHTNCIRVFESMCKPYITCQILIVDNNNIINGLNLEGGDQITFAFDGVVDSPSPVGFRRINQTASTGGITSSQPAGVDVYSQTQYVLSIEGEQSTENLRTTIYTIYTAGISYFKNQGSTVQRSALNMTGTALACQIHNEYVKDGGLSCHSSSGMIAKDSGGGYQVDKKRPFKAINDILDSSVASGYSTGSWVYFRDRRGHVIAPLEHLFSTMSAQERFWQRATWGAVFEHTLGGTNEIVGPTTAAQDSFHAVMAAHTVVKEKPGTGGRRGGGNIAAAAAGSLHIFDISNLFPAISSAAAAAVGGSIGGSSASGGAFAGKGGGMQNVFPHNENIRDLAANQLKNIASENTFQASVKDSVNYLVKVPIQSGIHVTVGKGADAQLIPPFGDVPGGRSDLGGSDQRIGGLMLVADVMHECYFDQRIVQGTTTMRMVSGYK